MKRTAAAIGVVIATAAPCTPAAGAPDVRRTPVVRAVERTRPAVVNLYTETIVQTPFGGRDMSQTNPTKLLAEDVAHLVIAMLTSLHSIFWDRPFLTHAYDKFDLPLLGEQIIDKVRSGQSKKKSIEIGSHLWRQLC